MNKTQIACLIIISALLGGCTKDKKPCCCCSDNYRAGGGLSEAARFLLDARYDHLRCEVKLDRLRDLYEVTPTEPGGLLDENIDAGPDSTGDIMSGSADDPLTGGHDGPLTGGHDGPLTGGHDDPLTGSHDRMQDNITAVVAAGEACWEASDALVEKYNSWPTALVT